MTTDSSDISRPTKQAQASFSDDGSLVVDETDPEETTWDEWGVDVPQHDPDTRLDKGEGSLTADTRAVDDTSARNDRQSPLFQGCADPEQETLGSDDGLTFLFGDDTQDEVAAAGTGLAVVLDDWLQPPASANQDSQADTASQPPA